MATIFTYGSLMCEDIMAAVTGQNLVFDEAHLLDYERYAVRDEEYPAIIPKTASTVQGRVYYGVNEEGVARLDSFEGDYYQRVLLKVSVLGRVMCLEKNTEACLPIGAGILSTFYSTASTNLPRSIWATSA